MQEAEPQNVRTKMIGKMAMRLERKREKREEHRLKFRLNMRLFELVVDIPHPPQQT